MECIYHSRDIMCNARGSNGRKELREIHCKGKYHWRVLFPREFNIRSQGVMNCRGVIIVFKTTNSGCCRGK